MENQPLVSTFVGGIDGGRKASTNPHLRMPPAVGVLFFRGGGLDSRRSGMGTAGMCKAGLKWGSTPSGLGLEMMKSSAEIMLENPDLPDSVRQKLLAGIARSAMRLRRREAFLRMNREFGPVYKTTEIEVQGLDEPLAPAPSTEAPKGFDL